MLFLYILLQESLVVSHCHDVTVTGGDAGFLPGLHDGVRSDPGDIVILADDGCADAAHDSSDGSHKKTLLYRNGGF